MGNSDSSQSGAQSGYLHREGNNAQAAYEQGVLEELDMEPQSDADERRRQAAAAEAAINNPASSTRGRPNITSPEGGGRRKKTKHKKRGKKSLVVN